MSGKSIRVYLLKKTLLLKRLYITYTYTETSINLTAYTKYVLTKRATRPFVARLMNIFCSGADQLERFL